MITAFLEFVGESCIIMTVVCQWIVPALAELLIFFRYRMDCPKEIHIEDILYLLNDFLIVSPTQNLCRQQLDPC